VRWAIVIGIDEYGSDDMRLFASVSDALEFRDWVLADGGGVPESNLRLLLSRRSDDPGAGEAVPEATKDNIVTAIHDVVVAAAEHEAERLYFYFAGHGITARVANRDESALVTPGFDALHPDHSLAVRSIAEYLETTTFADQFLFIDACRNVPWAGQEFEIGRWPVPRRRDPGTQPVQQFILYATSPGRTAAELGWPGEATGAFTSTLLEGLGGRDDAKAWSWERNCYEVRWERLASFINQRMRQRAGRPPEVPARDWPVQIPQDSGTRGVADRDRDVPVVSFASGRFPNLRLTVDLEADADYDDAEVSVLDALGEPVVRALGVTGKSQTFQLPPKTYAVRATTTAPAALFGALKAPIELYRDRTERIGLRPRATPPGAPVVAEPLGPEDIALAGREQPPGTIAISSHDPLAVAEIMDEAGRVVALTPAGEDLQTKPGFYHVRHIGPEATWDATFVVLAAGEREDVPLRPPPPDPFVLTLATALGGRVEAGYVRLGEGEGDGPMTWALPSTIVAAGVAAALQGRPPAGLGIGDVHRALGRAASGVAVLAVGRGADDEAARRLSVGIWPAGEPVRPDSVALASSSAGVASAVVPVDEPKPYWVSFRAAEAAPTVVAVAVLPGRLATLVAQLDSDRMRLYQYHPVVGPGASSTVSALRRVEYLQRMLVNGRVDIAEPLARQLAGAAGDDPFAGLVAGYLLLRLGRHEELEGLPTAILAAAPTLSDAYILRGEHEAWKGRPQAAAQAFADAINTGIPAFGEGLTRLVEGLRASGFTHPRAAVVRHVFQRHARGSMWAAFTPRRGLEPGRPVISAVDLGFEA
jgi:Caspase domain